MSVDNFIPQIWSGSILRAFDTALVFASGSVINRDYEGDLQRAGDSVRINMIGDVSVNSYAKNTDINSPETLTDDQTLLVVNQQKYFNFYLDSVDEAQAAVSPMMEAARRAAYSLAKNIDSYIAGLYTDIATTQINTTSAYAGINLGSDGSPLTGGWTTAGTMAYDKLVDLGVVLDSSDVPQEDRFVVVPPWFDGYLRKDERFVKYGTPIQQAVLRSGGLSGVQTGNPGNQPNGGFGTNLVAIGEAAGFTVFKSNQVSNTAGSPATKYKIIGGHPSAWSLAAQITELVAFTPERRFGDAMKGLVVYGAKVVRPYALAALTANAT